MAWSGTRHLARRLEAPLQRDWMNGMWNEASLDETVARYRRYGDIETEVSRDEAYGDAYCVVCRRSLVCNPCSPLGSLIWNTERFRETIHQSPLFTPVCKGACRQVRDMSLVIRDEEHALHWLMPFDVEYTWYLELIQEVKVDCELRVVENEVAASVLKAKRRLAIAKAMLPTFLAFEESGVQTIPFDLFFAIGSVCL
jgi:hypothetical protein